MRTPKGLVAAIRREPAFVLATHINPDGDALGSCLALAEALRSIGKNVVVYDRDPVPAQYRFMPGVGRFRTTLGLTPREKPFLLLLDCNSPERAAIEESAFAGSAVIDHHETETDFGDIRWIEPKAAATGLMVFHLIRALRITLTGTMATNLYISLAVDTGTFRYSNTTPAVLRVGAELIEAGASPGAIAEQLYEQWKRSRFELLTLSLRTLEIKDRIALMHVTEEMFRKTGTGEADTENFANLPRMIDSVLISALIRQVDNGRWKVSMRSKGQTNVARIAEVFGGGGHRNAAGFRIKADLEDVKKAILKSGKSILSKS